MNEHIPELTHAEMSALFFGPGKSEKRRGGWHFLCDTCGKWHRERPSNPTPERYKPLPRECWPQEQSFWRKRTWIKPEIKLPRGYTDVQIKTSNGQRMIAQWASEARTVCGFWLFPPEFDEQGITVVQWRVTPMEQDDGEKRRHSNRNNRAT